MSRGIQATVRFTAPDICPIVKITEETEAMVDSVVSSVCVTADGESVTDFSLDPEIDVGDGVTPVFSSDSMCRYRLSHTRGVGCPCECLGTHGCPVDRYVARNGTLTLAFHAAGDDELQAVVADLRERFPGMEIRRFVREPTSERSVDPVFFDRSKITARQLEVLETAYEMGYFERPRRANAAAVAAALGIDPTTFSEHLVAAQSKILADLL